jgi:hypothetical protein
VNSLPRKISAHERGAALLIVLVFAVLLTGLAVAYVSRTTGDRTVAHSSFNQTKVDELAGSATNYIVDDLVQEITSLTGSTQIPVSGSTVYMPNPSVTYSYVVPQRNATVPNGNLVRESLYPDTTSAPGVQSLASQVSSTTLSANNRSVTPLRWNKHYLLGSSVPSGFTSPYWVILTRSGRAQYSGWPGWSSDLATPSSSNSSYAIGRYAYAIYDEGGLLDANVAGCPSNTSPAQSGPKGISAFADLSWFTSSIGLQSTGIDALVGWRNYASSQQTQAFTGSGVFPNFTFNASKNTLDYFNFVLRNTGSASPTNGFTNVDWQIVYSPSGKGPRTDQGFSNRQTLIQFCLNVDTALNNPNAFPVSSLQYLGTFSRETNAPTFPYQSGLNLLLSRFPMGRFNDFATLYTTTTPSASVAADIKMYFGLQWTSSTSGGVWQYVGQSGSTPLSAIPSITAGTQPELFQILHYLFPSATTAQILSLGACIIDQTTPNGVTTQIQYGSGPPYQIAYGMKSPQSVSGPPPPPTPPNPYPILGRVFRSVGEIGYAYNPITSTYINFYTAPSSSNLDPRLLDYFTYTYQYPNPAYPSSTDTPAGVPPASPRGGIVNLNTQNAGVLAAIIKGAINQTQPSTTTVSGANATTAANSIVAETTNLTAPHGPAVSRADVARLAAAVGTTLGSSVEQKSTTARALAELGQTRTWGLMIDLIAQSGRYPPNANSLAAFMVEGETHYWVHVAIDRFTGQVIDKQIEVVNE